jgi:hypothetical protein
MKEKFDAVSFEMCDRSYIFVIINYLKHAVEKKGIGRLSKTLDLFFQVTAVIACDEHPCLAPHQILQLGHFRFDFYFLFYYIAVFCKI